MVDCNHTKEDHIYDDYEQKLLHYYIKIKNLNLLCFDRNV